MLFTDQGGKVIDTMSASFSYIARRHMAQDLHRTVSGFRRPAKEWNDGNPDG
jgi:hypothetical protein